MIGLLQDQVVVLVVVDQEIVELLLDLVLDLHSQEPALHNSNSTQGNMVELVRKDHSYGGGGGGGAGAAGGDAK